MDYIKPATACMTLGAADVLSHFHLHFTAGSRRIEDFQSHTMSVCSDQTPETDQLFTAPALLFNPHTRYTSLFKELHSLHQLFIKYT